MCEMQENYVGVDPLGGMPVECVRCQTYMVQLLAKHDNECILEQEIFDKVFHRRAKWRKRAETAELNFVKLREQFLEERERFDAERKALDDKRRDEVAKALGYRNIAEVIGISQVDYKLVCDELYSEVEALEYVKRKHGEGEYISFTDALREVRGIERRATELKELAYETAEVARRRKARLEEENKKLRFAVRILAPACVGLLTFAIASIIQTLC